MGWQKVGTVNKDLQRYFSDTFAGRNQLDVDQFGGNHSTMKEQFSSGGLGNHLQGAYDYYCGEALSQLNTSRFVC